MTSRFITMAAIACLSLSTIACKKDDNSKPVTTTGSAKTCYLKKAINANDYTQLSFDGSNRLTAMDDYKNDGTKKESTKIEYDAAGRVAHTKTYEGTVLTEQNDYEYNSEGKAVKIHYLELNDGSLEETEYDVITYTAGKVSRVTSFDKGSTEASSYIDYTWTGNNVTKMTHYEMEGSTASKTGETEITYDTKKKPMGTPMDPEEVTTISENNPTQFKGAFGTMGYTMNIAYEYNTDGFPTKRSTSGFGTPATTTFEYGSCK